MSYNVYIYMLTMEENIEEDVGGRSCVGVTIYTYTHIHNIHIYTIYIYIYTYIYMLYMLYKSHEIQWSRATTSASRRNAAMAWLPHSSPRTPSADAGRGWRAAATSSAMTLGPGC